MNHVELARESVLADMEWINANNPDPLSVLGGSVDKVLEHWEQLDDPTRRALLQRATQTFERAVQGFPRNDIDLAERDEAMA